MDHEVGRERSTRRDGPVWWAASQAVEWIAFRGIEPPIPWPPGWIRRDLDAGTLAAVAARADVSLRPEERIYRPRREEWSGRDYEQRSKVRRLLRELHTAGVPAAGLPARIRELAEAIRARDAARAAASSDLLAQVRSERLPISGSSPARDRHGDPTLDPAGLNGWIPAEVFADDGLILHADAVALRPGLRDWNGDGIRRDASLRRRLANDASPLARAQNLADRLMARWAPPRHAPYPLYVEVRFRVQDVRRLWPANPPPKRSTRKHIPDDTLQQHVRKWMAAEREVGRTPARKRCVPELYEALGCSRDALNAAYAVVCRADRIGPGRPPTKSAD